MKKILCLMLIAVMTLSLFAVPAYAEATLPSIADGDAIYVGEKTITVKLAEKQTATELTSEQAELVKITNLKTNENIEFTSFITGDILTLIPAKSFVVNAKDETDKTTYELKLGNITRSFSVDVLWTPSFVADTTNNKVSGLSLYQGSGLAVDVVNSDTIVVGSQGGAVYLDCEDLLTKENVSLVADVYYTGDSNRYSSVWGFNIPTKVAGILDTTNKYSGAGWRFQTRTGSYVRNYHSRTVVMANNGTNTASYGFNWKEPITEHKDILDENLISPYKDINFGTALASNANTIKVGTVELTEAFTNENKYHYAIDKMGEIATLTIGGVLVDVLDTQEYYDKHSLTAPKTGYFSLATYADLYNRKTVFSNIKLITSSVRELAKGTISVESVTAERGMITVEFASDGSKFDVSAVENIKNYVVLSEGDYDIVSAEGETLVIKVKNISYEPATITVKQGFGYDELKVSQDIVEDYQFVAREGDITFDSLKGTFNTITLGFNVDMSDTENIDDKIKLLSNGTEISFTSEVEGQLITLKLDEKLVADYVYDLVIEEGLGYEKVTLKNTISKYITIETIKEVTFDDGKYTDYVRRDVETGNLEPYTTVRNGKLYLENGNYATLYFDKFGLENLESYIMTFDMEHYRANADAFMLNVPTDSSGTIYYGKKLKGIGWKALNGNWVHCLQWLSTVRTTNVYGNNGVANPDGAVGGYINDIFKIEKDDGDVTIPETTPIVTSYTIEKDGTKAKLYVNNNLVDSLDMEKTVEIWNTNNPTAKITDSIPEKGYFVYSATHATNGDVHKSAVTFDNMMIYQFKEYESEDIRVFETDKNISSNTASGKLYIRNFSANKNQKVAVLVTAYGDDNKFLGIKKVYENNLSAGTVVEKTYSFTASEEIKDIKVTLLDENMLSASAEISVVSALQTDFDNNVITVKGKIKPAVKDREIYMLLAKDDGFVTPWTATSENEGVLSIVNIPADAESFEYSFKYKDDADTEPYKMSIYALLWNDGIELKDLLTYNYAKNEDVLAFVEAVKSTKTTFTEVEKYAQSLGIDISFANTEYNQRFLVDTIFDEKDSITDKASLIVSMEKAKARADMINALYNEASTETLVNKVIKDYSTDADLDLTSYNALSSAQKNLVCASFINVNYLETGYAEFLKDFVAAIKTASETIIPSGGGSGGGGGGAGGGYVAPAPIVPSGAEVTVAPDEYTDKPSAEIIGKQGFADMTEYSWAESAVNALSDKGVLAGVGNNMFNPEGVVTREQIAKMIVSTLGELDNDAKAEYVDVDTSGWAYKFIATAKKIGLMNGISDNEFAPLVAVTREDLAVILYRASLKNGKKYDAKKSDFTDITNISDYAVEAVEYMAGAGIINGFEDGSFNPKAPATRAQAAVLIYNTLIGGDK